MANKKFSEFVLKTDTSDVSHIVGYNGAENVQITPANFVTGGGTGVFLPLAGGTMTGALVVDAQGTFNDILTAGLGLAITGGAVGSAKLVLASNNAVYLRGSSAGLILQNSDGTNSLTVDTNSVFSGSLGLAGVTPSEKLDTPNMVISGSTITGTTRANALYVDNLGGNSRFFSCGADASSNGSYSFRTGTSATLGATLLTLTSTESTFSTQANLIDGTAASPSLIFGGDGDTGLFHPSANTIAFSTFGSERMRLDSSGNLGLGTSTPGNYRLNVSKGAVGDVAQITDGVANTFIIRTDANTLYTGNANNLPLAFLTNNIEKMRLDSAGNLGVGTATPLAKLHIKDGSTLSSALTNTSALIEGFSQSILQIASHSSGYGQIAFGDQDDGFDGGIIYSNSSRYLSFEAANSERMRLDASGNLGIGRIPGFEQLSVKSTSSNNVARFQVDVNGNGILFANAANTIVGSIAINTSSTAYNTSSDYRLKEDLQDFEGLDLVSKIPVYDYKWKADESRSYGVMAHQLQEVLPQAVTGEKDAEEMQSVDYSKIVPLLVKSIQELSAKLEALECQCEKK